MDSNNVKRSLVGIIKGMGKKKLPKKPNKFTVNVDGVSTQFFSETEVLSKSYSGEKSKELRKALRAIAITEQES